ETHVDGQHHPQQELVDGHHARNAVNGQSFFNQFLEAQFLQHGRYGEQTTIGRKILGSEVKRRGSRYFIGLRTICRKALFVAGFLDMLLFVLHHLGDPLEVEFVKPASFANSFLPHVFGVPKWFLQITALQKPTPVHYSGRTHPPAALFDLQELSGPTDQTNTERPFSLPGIFHCKGMGRLVLSAGHAVLRFPFLLRQQVSNGRDRQHILWHAKRLHGDELEREDSRRLHLRREGSPSRYA